MNEAKFTKGPLTIKGPSLGRGSNDDGGDYAILDGEGCIIGEAICRVETDEIRPARENATLWAIAHEMYEALEDAIKRMADIAHLLGGEPSLQDIKTAYETAYSGEQRDALAKARGEA